MSHKPNLLSWDQDVAPSPREFHETNNNRTNSAALLATLQYFSFRHIWFSKLLSHQKLPPIILSYFSNALSFDQGKRSFQISGKLSSFAKITNKKIARHFEKHRCVTWRHTGSDQSTNVHPRDAPSLLLGNDNYEVSRFSKERVYFNVRFTYCSWTMKSYFSFPPYCTRRLVSARLQPQYAPTDKHIVVFCPHRVLAFASSDSPRVYI